MANIFKLNSLASTNLLQIGGPLAQLYGWNIVNTNAAAMYVKFYWGPPGTFASSGDVPTVGTDIPKITVMVPGTGTAVMPPDMPLQDTGSLFMATTTTAADSGSTAVGAGDLIISVFYGG